MNRELMSRVTELRGYSFGWMLGRGRLLRSWNLALESGLAS
jgi:hypothetical protein